MVELVSDSFSRTYELKHRGSCLTQLVTFRGFITPQICKSLMRRDKEELMEGTIDCHVILLSSIDLSAITIFP